jgi:hypothetical protein
MPEGFPGAEYQDAGVGEAGRTGAGQNIGEIDYIFHILLSNYVVENHFMT